MCGVRKYGMTKMTGVSEAWQMLHEGTFVFKMLILRPWYNKSMTLYVLLTSHTWIDHKRIVAAAIRPCMPDRPSH